MGCSSFLNPNDGVLEYHADGTEYWQPDKLEQGYKMTLLDYMFGGGLVLTFWLVTVYLKVVSIEDRCFRSELMEFNVWDEINWMLKVAHATTIAAADDDATATATCYLLLLPATATCQLP